LAGRYTSGLVKTTRGRVAEDTAPPKDGDVEGLTEDVLPGVAALTVSPGREGKGVTRPDTNVEVVFFHAWPTNLYTELLQSFCLKGTLGLVTRAATGQHRLRQVC